MREETIQQQKRVESQIKEQIIQKELAAFATIDQLRDFKRKQASKMTNDTIQQHIERKQHQQGIDRYIRSGFNRKEHQN